MVCVHLKQLYQLCQEQQIRLGGSDLIRIVCKQCGEQDICPTNLMELTPDEDESAGGQGEAGSGERSSGQASDASESGGFQA